MAAAKALTLQPSRLQPGVYFAGTNPDGTAAASVRRGRARGWTVHVAYGHPEYHGRQGQWFRTWRDARRAALAWAAHRAYVPLPCA
jgi:hypothetical protein